MAIFSICVVAVMVLFALVGIFDSLVLKSKLGLGTEFQKGMEMIGPLCLAIIGIYSLCPAIGWALEKTLTPLYAAMGMDPSMAVSAILAMDMGGLELSKSVALDPTIGLWAGTVYGSMMGATIVFSIPVGLAAISKKDVSAFSKGILYGIAAIPFGTLVGGLMMGIDAIVVLKNLIIPVIFSAIIVLCLALFQKATVKVFTVFSEIVNIVAMVGLALALVNDLILIPLSAQGLFDHAAIPFFNKYLAPTSVGIGVAGAIGLVLAGALPFIAVLNKLLKKPLSSLSAKTGMTEAGVTGFLLSSANNMAMFATMEKMKEKEKILNVAFAVCAAFVIGDHLAFAAGAAPDCIAPMMASKLISGVIAVLIAVIFTKGMKNTDAE